MLRLFFSATWKKLIGLSATKGVQYFQVHANLNVCRCCIIVCHAFIFKYNERSQSVGGHCGRQSGDKWILLLCGSHFPHAVGPWTILWSPTLNCHVSSISSSFLCIIMILILVKPCINTEHNLGKRHFLSFQVINSRGFSHCQQFWLHLS